MKRKTDDHSGNPRKSKLPPSLRDKVEAAKQKLNGTPTGKTVEKTALNVELHPLLKQNVTSSIIPKDYNPVLHTKVRPGFSASQLNPYLDQTTLSKPTRPYRPLKFVEKGTYVKKAEEQRERLKKQQEEQQLRSEKESLGLEPDEALGEQYYKPILPPSIEPWDKPLLKGNSYDNLDDVTFLDSEDEDNPITIYIQHPVPIPCPWEKNEPAPPSLYLTKEEQKRLRRNERAIKHKEIQDRIKLGLDPAPPPKVKLKNLMNVLTNDAIKDPTALEAKVRAEVEERKLKHEMTNEERKLTPEQKAVKRELKKMKELDRGIYCAVFKIDRLVNPKHIYKVDINAKQNSLVGSIVSVKDTFSLIVVEGGEKSIRKYKNLLLNRINWTENEHKKKPEGEEKTDQEEPILEDLSSNQCFLLWEGPIADFRFRGWSNKQFEDELEALNFLGFHQAEMYWREAKVTFSQ
ncbi:Splicing factor, component of the U4/U6-U5 snRNP complex [Komagataella phaffii CBS 7435]|uniref:Uncharacterized protein n=2 Tax=Komagataella phaffii TaxID=460519 RepID=C4R3D6_KOMPG|nr:uncharacterized protein PAS_chr3_1147 [Komagataella phaffii GS115]AOA63517.1 GQ67_03055T0 [Komagataella phaffii]CAH2450310.1 Splicing factor [Komagataella phaffii CBS 7435]AOA69210.1 GQ68_03040T0 [Komagataella phaffii GS115]CAY69971.1 hypothetical protein PAS_chr3_1147 [Komagataella phaffii GS115]CCA40140.1 Splicing factor, component of the U4/U6-U5 snRNP complex [Komagataella phaffii CBS 7435]